MVQEVVRQPIVVQWHPLTTISRRSARYRFRSSRPNVCRKHALRISGKHGLHTTSLSLAPRHTSITRNDVPPKSIASTDPDSFPVGRDGSHDGSISRVERGSPARPCSICCSISAVIFRDRSGETSREAFNCISEVLDVMEPGKHRHSVLNCFGMPHLEIDSALGQVPLFICPRRRRAIDQICEAL